MKKESESSSASSDSDDNRGWEEREVMGPRRPEKRDVALALFLGISGLVFLGVGVLIFIEYFESEELRERLKPLIVIGLLMAIPGVYQSWVFGEYAVQQYLRHRSRSQRKEKKS